MSQKSSLIVLHGALGAISQFEQLIDLLSPHFEVHTLNFSGHGGRPFNNDFSIDEFAKNLGTYLQENTLEKVDIFGYSMGGYIALKFAKNHPEKVGKIHTLGTKFDWTPETAAKEVKMLNPERIEEKVPAFAHALAKRHAPNDWKDVLKRTKDMMLGLGQKNALSPEDFSFISHETIIGIGDLDNMVSLEESEHVANTLPNGSIKVFEGFKHPIEQIDTALFSQSLISFFD